MKIMAQEIVDKYTDKTTFDVQPTEVWVEEVKEPQLQNFSVVVPRRKYTQQDIRTYIQDKQDKEEVIEPQVLNLRVSVPYRKITKEDIPMIVQKNNHLP